MKMFRRGVFVGGVLASASAHAAEPGINDRITAALSGLGYSDISINSVDNTLTVVARRPGVPVPSCFDLIVKRLVERRCRPVRPAGSLGGEDGQSLDTAPAVSGIEIEDLSPDTSTDEGADTVQTEM